jgi:methionyl-tRNA formyltransferase
MDSQPRIAFWGTPSLTITYLEALKALGVLPVVIVTNPDRPVGRHQAMTPPEPKVWALAHGIPVLQPEKLGDETFAELEKMNLDLSVVVAYGSIIPERFITLPKHKTINVHYSLLPKYRGAAPTEAAILAGDAQTGVSIQMMQKKLDTGPVIAEEVVNITDSEATPELRARLTAIGAQLLCATLPKILRGEISLREQDESQATHCGKIQKADAEIDPDGDQALAYRKYRAYKEWPRAFFFTEKEGKPLRVIITQAHFADKTFVIEKVLPEGKKEMSFADFQKN